MQGPDDRAQRIRATVDSIPRGRVATYGQVAAAAGLPGRARLVGRVLRDLEPGAELPWYRVVAAGGRIAVPGSTAGRQRKLLRAEGVALSGERVRLAEHRWDEGL